MEFLGMWGKIKNKKPLNKKRFDNILPYEVDIFFGFFKNFEFIIKLSFQKNFFFVFLVLNILNLDCKYFFKYSF